VRAHDHGARGARARAPGAPTARAGDGHRRSAAHARHARARAHFQPSAQEGAWVEQAETVEHERTNSELGALLLESRLIKRLRPPGNARLKHIDRYVYLRCRLDIAFPILEVAPAPAAGRGVSVGPLRGRAAAVELLEQLNSLFGLRHCARKLPRRYWPSAYGQMGRCLSPCLGDLDPNLYRRRLDEALALFTGEGDGGAALLAHLDQQMRAAAAEQNFERAAWLRRRRERLAWLLERLGGVLAATHARPKLVLAEHPQGGRCDAFWLVGGRVVDWGPPGELDDVMQRTVRALRGGDGTGATACLAPDEVDEARIVATWLDAHEGPALDLHGGADRAAVGRLLASAHDDGHAHAGRVQRADDAVGARAGQAPREHAA
jgi:DNA polymerase III subunit epsilon